MYIIHADKKKHKYVAKVGEGKDARYFYSEKDYQNYLKGVKAAGKDPDTYTPTWYKRHDYGIGGANGSHYSGEYYDKKNKKTYKYEYESDEDQRDTTKRMPSKIAITREKERKERVKKKGIGGKIRKTLGYEAKDEYEKALSGYKKASKNYAIKKEKNKNKHAYEVVESRENADKQYKKAVKAYNKYKKTPIGKLSNEKKPKYKN